MTSLEELKRKKLEQLQAQQQQEAQVAQQVQMLETAVRQVLTKEALERYGNLKAAHPEKAIQLLAVLGQLIQTQNIKQITDEQLKQILLQFNQKKEFKITRK